MFVGLACLLIALFIMDRGREEIIRKYEALAAGIQASIPLQVYLMQYHDEHQGWPDGTAALQAVVVELPESVRDIAVAQDGTITLTYTGAVHEDGKVHLRPQVSENGRVVWACLGEALPEDVLPRECSLVQN